MAEGFCRFLEKKAVQYWVTPFSEDDLFPYQPWLESKMTMSSWCLVDSFSRSVEELAEKRGREDNKYHIRYSEFSQ